MWGRGLKRCPCQFGPGNGVAPHVGAWIETSANTLLSLSPGSPPMWGRGLKLEFIMHRPRQHRRPLCGGVD